MQIFAQQIVINELMTLNTNSIQDEDGDFPDWIEIYNNDAQTINLNGFGLTDDRQQLNKWSFPDLSLDPQQFLLVFASGKNKRNYVKHWETIINHGDIWKYRRGISEPPENWRTVAFDDGTWSSGPTGIGYGDGDDATVISAAMSVYLRKKFTITNIEDVASLVLHIDYDDAFVAYLNDIEIVRNNIGNGSSIPSYNQNSNSPREAEMYQGGLPEVFMADAFVSLLQDGDNVLTIQVHNANSNSSDMSVIPFFTLGLKNIPANPNGTPEILQMSFSSLHTNFKLSSEGEDLFLTNPDSSIIDSVSIGVIPGDFSIGRQPDGAADWYIFEEPTPESGNSTNGYPGIASSPEFSLPAGLYAGARAMSISADPGIQVYYTTDGSEPTESSAKYTEPLLIDATMVIRARAYETGNLPSEIITATYVINDSFHMPVVSLTTDPDNLWDYYTGIYVMGPNAQPDIPHFGANFWQDWERPIHVEFFETDGTQGFQTNAGIKIVGGWTRSNPQKSVAIILRRRYGQASIDYPLFPELNITEYNSFLLRNSGNDWPYTMMRDAMMTGLSTPLDIEHMAYRPVIVFLNGEFWGIHNMREKMNEDYLAAHFDINPLEVDILEDNNTVIEGTAEHYDMMINYITNNDISNPAVYANLQTLMDVDNFINYQILQIYYANTDWPGNNIKYWRSQTANGRWRWMLFDTDFGFSLYEDNVSHNTLAFATDQNGPGWPNPPWATYLLRRLLENGVFRVKFINAFADYLNEYLSRETISDFIDGLKDGIKDDMRRHLGKWGGTYNNWDFRVTSLKIFAAQRPDNVRAHIENQFGLSGRAEITLNNSNPLAGNIKLNSLLISDDEWSGIYFKNNSVQITAIPESGYWFAGWTGGLISNSDSIEVSLTGNLELTALFVKDSSVIINEINYNSSADFLVGDWVEFYNSSTFSIDMTNWKFSDSDDLHIFQFPDQLTLQPDSFVVIVRDSAMFATLFPEVKNIAGYFDFGMSNGGEHIRLFDAMGRIVDSLTYTDQSPWPLEPDGTGATLALMDPYSDNALASSWAGSRSYGTPGTSNDNFLNVVTVSENRFPDYYELGQNYPNPFNPVTTIPVKLPVKADLQINVYDITGRLVEVLVNNTLPAGSHKFIWEPDNNIASGVYFYRLEIKDKYQNTQKMLYIR